MRNQLGHLLFGAVLAVRLAAAGAAEEHCGTQARRGVDDLLRHFWTGDERTGHIVGGSWAGPAEGSGSRWFVKNSQPQQIMTSANTVNMLVTAAVLAGGSGAAAPSTPAAPNPSQNARQLPDAARR